MGRQKELIEDLQYEVYYVDANDDGHLVAAVFDLGDAFFITDLLDEKHNGGHQVFNDGKRIHKED